MAKKDFDLSQINREFKTEYQPLVSLKDQQFVGFETILSWQDQRSQLYSSIPMHLIDETGLSVFVRSWLLRTVSQQLYRWNQEFFVAVPLMLTVPLTEKQWLLPGLPETLRAIARDMGWRVQGLVLEIEYSTLMNHIDWSANLTKELQSMGICIQVSGLIPSHLAISVLEFCKITHTKLDPSILTSLASTKIESSFWSSILHKLNDLQFKVTVPRIETSESLTVMSEEYGITWHVICATPVDAYQATLLIQADSKLAQLRVSTYLAAMNRLSQFVQTLLGQTLVNRYWSQSCPNGAWLQSDRAVELQAGQFVSLDDFRLSAQQIQEIKQWVNGFMSRCSGVILNLRSLMKTSDLTLADIEVLHLQR